MTKMIFISLPVTDLQASMDPAAMPASDRQS